jgi:hypothetical protein
VDLLETVRARFASVEQRVAFWSIVTTPTIFSWTFSSNGENWRKPFPCRNA